MGHTIKFNLELTILDLWCRALWLLMKLSLSVNSSVPMTLFKFCHQDILSKDQPRYWSNIRRLNIIFDQQKSRELETLNWPASDIRDQLWVLSFRSRYLTQPTMLILECLPILLSLLDLALSQSKVLVLWSRLNSLISFATQQEHMWSWFQFYVLLMFHK
jgi:hypothetical protein